LSYNHLPLHQRPFRIVMLGRMFDAVQQKGHMVAINAFTRLQAMWLAAPNAQRPPLELYVVGAVMRSHQAYAARVRALAREAQGVHVVLDASRQQVLSILSTSRVVWSMTGFRQSRERLKRVGHLLSLHHRRPGGPLAAVSAAHRICDPSISRARRSTAEHCPDPADTEHFGIAVTEAMSAGAIPVLLHMGALAELVPSSHVGRLAQNSSEVVLSTLEVLSQSDAELDAMSDASIAASTRFTGGTFQRHFKAMAIQLATSRMCTSTRPADSAAR